MGFEKLVELKIKDFLFVKVEDFVRVVKLLLGCFSSGVIRLGHKICFSFCYRLFLFQCPLYCGNFILFQVLHDELRVQQGSAITFHAKSGKLWNNLVEFTFAI